MRVHITLPEDTVREIDEIAGTRGRSKYIADAVTAAAKRDRLLKVLREGAGTLDMSRHPEWSTPQKVAKWVHDLRYTPSSRPDAIERVLARVPVGRRPRNRVAKAKVKSR
jgi:metal-responsive CopG/Arc/MetJ family transcriptional regulator